MFCLETVGGVAAVVGNDTIVAVGVKSLRISPDGRHLATVGRDGNIRYVVTL